MEDKRRKLSDSDRDEIKRNRFNLTIAELASEYNVSRRTVEFLLYPEKRAENRKRYKEKGGWRQHYDNEVHAENMARYRKRLKGL